MFFLSSLHPEDIVKFLQDVTNAKLIAMTHGGKDTILAVEDHVNYIFMNSGDPSEPSSHIVMSKIKAYMQLLASIA